MLRHSQLLFTDHHNLAQGLINKFPGSKTDPDLLFYSRDHRHHQERMPTEIKEVIIQTNLLHPKFKKGQRAYGVPSTRIAESMGRVIVQNIVMLGFFTAATQLVTRDEMREAVKGSVPAGTEELNLKAFDAGCAYYDEEYGEGKAAAGREATAAEPAVKG